MRNYVIRPSWEIKKVIDSATQAQAIVLLDDVQNFVFPGGSKKLEAHKTTAASLSSQLSASAAFLPVVKQWLYEFVRGYPACEQASFWVKG